MCLFEITKFFPTSKMSFKPCRLLNLVQSGSSSVELMRKDRGSPVGKYFSSVKVNGQYQSG